MVPILVHAFYDFSTIFMAWMSASAALNETLEEAQERLVNMPLLEPEGFRALSKKVSLQEYGLRCVSHRCRAQVFDIVDTNKDGAIDKEELVSAQRLMK